jgi:hypothetical protein
MKSHPQITQIPQSTKFELVTLRNLCNLWIRNEAGYLRNELSGRYWFGHMFLVPCIEGAGNVFGAVQFSVSLCLVC